MPRYIVKLADRYLEWSTIGDGPITEPMTRDEFEAYYRDEYGRSEMENLARRMARVEAKGTSEIEAASVDDTISANRAGPNETTLTKDQLIAALGLLPENHAAER